MVITLLITGIPYLSNGQDPVKTFQKGLVKEEGEGALLEAIELYDQVLNDESADRSIRAKALLHIGLCHEKLGQERAKAAYQQLVRDFSDQVEIARIGKQKLLQMEPRTDTKLAQGITIKQIWGPAEDTYGVSPDGRYATYIDWNAIELAVKDLVSGKSWFLTDRGTWKEPIQFPDNSIWLPGPAGYPHGG
jgi:tetratricopeptide (TPR) repeat protein